MRIFRLVAIVAGAALGLLLLGIIALFLFVDPNSYRGDIEKAAREHSARVLTIRGKLGLKVFPSLALSVGDVELSNRPGFGQQPFLTVQNASIGVKLLPLLSKRLEVSRVQLEGAHLNLVSRGPIADAIREGQSVLAADSSPYLVVNPASSTVSSSPVM